MSKFLKFELNSDGVVELMKSDAMKSICKEYADNAVDRLGEGYEADVYDGKDRCNASVSAVTAAAQKENLQENTILKAVMGG